eukprot:3941481-Rhodomonas_salina.7
MGTYHHHDHDRCRGKSANPELDLFRHQLVIHNPSDVLLICQPTHVKVTNNARYRQPESISRSESVPANAPGLTMIWYKLHCKCAFLQFIWGVSPVHLRQSPAGLSVRIRLVAA